jgi:2-oxoglutarate ferredoxin oxidoreductase subunit beta
MILTGLLYVDPECGDMHDFLDVAETPLNQLGEAELCPGSAGLAQFNATHR